MATIHMTMGPQKMYIPNNANCVIVPNLQTQNILVKTPGKRPLAPAPDRNAILTNNNNNNQNSNDLRCKRKIQFVPYGAQPQQPAAVARRNARERNRVKQVNNGFATLRQHIPASIAAAFSPQGASPPSGRGASKKLSKVETLKLAVEYIRSLQQMIEEHESEAGSTQGDGMSENRFYTSSPDRYHQNYPVLLPTPTCSEASQSPTPSQDSENSLCTPQTYNTTYMYNHQDYENFEPNSPEDEELLTAICLWQQQETN